MNSSRTALVMTTKTSENTRDENKLKFGNFQYHFQFLSNFKFSTSGIGGTLTPLLPKVEMWVIVIVLSEADLGLLQHPRWSTL